MDRGFHEDGLMMRITGDTIALSPPLIITEDQIGEIIDKLAQGDPRGGVSLTGGACVRDGRRPHRREGWRVDSADTGRR